MKRIVLFATVGILLLSAVGAWAAAPSEQLPAPTIVTKVQPQYPPEAKAKGVSGPVVLRVSIDTQGSPQSLRVVSGDPLLAQAAADAVRQWRWKPVQIKGKAVPVETDVTVNFVLAKKP